MVRPTALLLCLTALLLIHPPTATGQSPTKSKDATLAPLEKRDLNNLGVSLVLTKPAVPPAGQTPVAPLAQEDFAASPATDTLSVNVGTYLQVRYRLPGDPEGIFKPIAQINDALTSDVRLFEVQFLWCADDNTCDPAPEGYPKSSCPPAMTNKDNKTIPAPCTIYVIFDHELVDAANTLIPAFVLSQNGLLVSETLIQKAKDPASPTFTINGIPLKQLFEDYKTPHAENSTASNQPNAARSGWQSVTDFHFERYPPAQSCRPYRNEDDKDAIDASRPVSKEEGQVIMGKFAKDNGIYLDPPKVFDVFTLRQMLNGTASQLAGLAGFSPTSINAAFGNLQGIVTENSYLSGQVTTVGTPVVSSTAANGATGSNTFANSFGLNGTGTNSSSILYCPAGTLPSYGTGGIPACAPLQTANAGFAGTSTGVNNPNGGASTFTNQQGTNGYTLANSGTNTQGTTQQNSTTTTSGGQAGTVAPVLASNTIASPTNVGVSASDILTEQVQLNSQITNLRIALQGALSDAYLTRQGKATGTRQQATIGFNISLDPPQRYKHAVAEVKIWIYHHGGDDAIKVVNLLPAAKTYNVAKVTSSQKAFGAGAVIDLINVGAAGGKSKSRLYLAKDTDTVALLYPADKFKGKPHLDSWSQGATAIGRSPQEDL